jgi:hypothetical protein
VAVAAAKVIMRVRRRRIGRQNFYAAPPGEAVGATHDCPKGGIVRRRPCLTVSAVGGDAVRDVKDELQKAIGSEAATVVLLHGDELSLAGAALMRAGFFLG